MNGFYASGSSPGVQISYFGGRLSDRLLNAKLAPIGFSLDLSPTVQVA